MDATFFYIASFLSLMLGLIGLIRREDFAKLMFPFVGGIIAILVTVSANSDGAITGPATALWPALYLPILFAVMDFGILAVRNID